MVAVMIMVTIVIAVATPVVISVLVVVVIAMVFVPSAMQSLVMVLSIAIAVPIDGCVVDWTLQQHQWTPKQLPLLGRHCLSILMGSRSISAVLLQEKL